MAAKDNVSLLKDTIQKIKDSLEVLPVIDLNEIPNIDLYMDQVTTFMDEHLSVAKRNADDKLLTKTMINNYTKNKLLPPPVKKKYTKEHILVLFFIYYFKNFLSLQDIQSLLGPLNEQFFRAEGGTDLSRIYQEIEDTVISQTPELSKEIGDLAQRAQESFQDSPPGEKDFLQYFTLICCLSIDVLIKKRVIEQLIDAALPADRKEKDKKKS